MTSRTKAVAVAGVLLGLALIAPFTDPFVILLITRALILAILAMSLDILLGFTGLPSLGQAAYLGARCRAIRQPRSSSPSRNRTWRPGLPSDTHRCSQPRPRRSSVFSPCAPVACIS